MWIQLLSILALQKELIFCENRLPWMKAWIHTARSSSFSLLSPPQLSNLRSTNSFKNDITFQPVIHVMLMPARQHICILPDSCQPHHWFESCTLHMHPAITRGCFASLHWHSPGSTFSTVRAQHKHPNVLELPPTKSKKRPNKDS